MGRSRSSSLSSSSTARFQIERLGQLLVDETEVTVEVEICAVDVGKKLKAKSKPRTRKQEASTTKLDKLKSSVYGVTASTRSYVTGSWKPASSDIMRSEPEYLAKYFEGRGLTEKVMGNADYHPSPVVLICPFDSCKKSHRVLNGVSERRVAAVLALDGEAREQPDGDRAREAVAAGA